MNRLATMIALLAALALSPIAPARAADGDPELRSALRIAARYAGLAGSHDNALALALALRSGRPARLAEAGGALDFARIQPPPRGMAWRTVDASLAAARDVLLRFGVARPSAAQLCAALTGGVLADAEGGSVAFPGVLDPVGVEETSDEQP